MALPIAGLGLRIGAKAASAVVPSGGGPRGFRINVETDIKKAAKMLKRVGERNLPLAIAQSLTATAAHLRKVQQSTLPKYIDRPTPWTKKGIFYKRADWRDYRRGTLYASVYVDKDRADYLKFQVFGGRRLPKKRAVVVPGLKTRLNKYGNLSKKFIQTQLAKENTYIDKINGTAGLYQRQKSGRLKLLVLFADDANYKPNRWPFYKISKRIVARELPKQVNKAVRRALNKGR